MSINFLAYDYPDIEIVVGAGGLSGDLSGAMRTMVGITDEFYHTVFRDIIGKVSYSQNRKVPSNYLATYVKYF